MDDPFGRIGDVSIFCYSITFKWTDDYQRAFQDLKAYLTIASLLSPPVLGEELYLYLAVTLHVVSSALVREEGRVQKSVYYTSRALREAEG